MKDTFVEGERAPKKGFVVHDHHGVSRRHVYRPSRGGGSESALQQWAAQIGPIDIAYFSEARKEELIDAIDEWLAASQGAAAITGTRNVWCHTQSIGGFQMLINVVATTKKVVPARRR